MSNETYTIKEVLEHYFEDMKVDIKEIKAQTIQTNGRVTKLEQWRWYILGGLAVLAVTGYAYFDAQVAKSVDKIFRDKAQLQVYLSDAGYEIYED